MSSRTRANPQPHEPRYVSWRGELISKLALTRAGFFVQDGPAPEPFDLLVATAEGFYFLVEVKAYSSIRGHRKPLSRTSDNRLIWPLDASVLRATGEVNLPVVLFVVDADREVGYYARLDRVPAWGHNRQSVDIALTAEHDLSPESLVALVSELRQEWALSRRPA